jgi:branched-chain amino acid transport system permease protein
MLFGLSGVLSFGQAMFFAAGAYGIALLNQYHGIPFLTSLFLSGLLGGLLAVLLGWVALRRSEGVYFAILTLAFAELLHLLISNLTYFGRNDGLSGLKRPILDVLGVSIDLTQGDDFYYFIVFVCVLLIAVLRWIISTSFGRALQALKQDPERAEFLGIPVKFHRLAGWAQIVTPELAHWSNSTNPILYTLLGGSAYFWGPVLGAVVLSAVFYVTRTMVGMSDLVTGGLLLAVVLALPGGILGLLDRWFSTSRRNQDKS